jgi:hypothetical protein
MRDQQKKEPKTRYRRTKGPVTTAPPSPIRVRQAADQIAIGEYAACDEAETPNGPDEFGEGEFAGIETTTEREPDSVETLPELEREIGIADWIDPETGEPAEGQSPPHLNED